MIGEYHHGESLLHRLPAGAKLAALAAAGTSIFLISSPWLLAGALAATLLLYRIAGLPIRLAAEPIRAAFAILAVIFVAQWLLNGWLDGLVVVLRFAFLIVLANLVTLTTSVGAMMKRLEVWMTPLAWFGASPAKASFTLSLAIRFIPLLASIGAEVREAQRARGMDRNILALMIPLIVRTLKMADEIAEALEARGYDPGARDEAGSRRA